MKAVAQQGANALLVEFTDSEFVKLLVRGYTRVHGGTWVGGRATLTGDWVSFTTNLANRAMHRRRADTTFPLDEVLELTVVAGVGTNIVAVRTHYALLQMRMWRAESFARTIAEAANGSDRPVPLTVRKVADSRYNDELRALLLALIT